MTSQSIPTAGGLRQDLEVLGFVGTAHFLAHFYVIVLPPIFPILARDLGVSYAALGMLLTVQSLSSSLVQVPVGFLVDRVGARRVLIFGIGTMAGAVALCGLTGSYWLLLALMVLIGLGNSAFHPANYSIMARRVSPQRLGRAFSIHTFAGHIGWAVAPGIVVGLTALSSWRVALALVGLFGLGVMAGIWAKGRGLEFEDAPAAWQEPGREGESTRSAPSSAARLLLSRTMLFLLLYMVLSALATSGLNGFVVTALVDLYDTPLATASLGLTIFLVTSAVGVLIGGQLADWTRRYEVILGVGFVGGGLALAAVGGLPLGFTVAMVAIALAGLSLGAIRPSRDMIVRRVAPAGAEGKVFGFVTMGMNVGGALSPVLFGWLIDQGAAAWIFYLSAMVMIAALAAALLAASSGRRAA